MPRKLTGGVVGDPRWQRERSRSIRRAASLIYQALVITRLLSASSESYKKEWEVPSRKQGGI